MKKILYIGLIIISLGLFGGLIYITIHEDELPKVISTIGFIILGYIAIIIFTYSWFKIFKKK